MKSIILSTFSAWLARLLAIGLNIFGLPLALEKLGQSRFSLLLVVLSIGSWIGFANVGMGRVIANVIARDHKGTSKFVVRAVSTATVLAGTLNFLLFFVSSAAFLIIISRVPLNDMIQAHYTEFVVSVLTLFFALSLWFFLSIFEGIDAGHHQLHRLYLFQLASYAVSFFLLFTTFRDHPSIAFAAYVLNLSFILGSVCHAIDVIRRNRSLFTLKFKWQRRTLRLLLLTSLDFTIINLGLGILFQLATGLFGVIAGPDAVVDLGIFMRLMQSYGSLVIAFTYPLSNIIASKLASRDDASVIKAARWSSGLLLSGAAIAGVGFFFFSNEIFSLWLRSSVRFDTLFLATGAVLIWVSALHFYLAALLVGDTDTKVVARIHFSEAIAFVPFAYILFNKLGQGGVLLALDIMLCAGILLMARRVLAHEVLGTFFSAYRSLAGRDASTTAEQI